MSWSHHGMTVRRGVAPRDEVLELPLDVGEQRAGAESEQIRLEPAGPELVLHEAEVLERALRAADAPGRLVSHGIAGRLMVFADYAQHHEAERARRVDGRLAGSRLG